MTTETPEQAEPAPERPTRAAEPTINDRIVAVLGVCIVLGGFAAFVWNRAEAQTSLQLSPVEKRVTFMEQQVGFMVGEQREGRIDTRKAIDQLGSLTGDRPSLKPLAPLPIQDGGQ